jgi:hypothetical protein
VRTSKRLIWTLPEANTAKRRFAVSSHSMSDAFAVLSRVVCQRPACGSLEKPPIVYKRMQILGLKRNVKPGSGRFHKGLSVAEHGFNGQFAAGR